MTTLRVLLTLTDSWITLGFVLVVIRRVLANRWRAADVERTVSACVLFRPVMRSISPSVLTTCM